MALPLTPQCVFLSPSWTTARWDPYLVIVGGGKGKALKARLCGDAIRQTAVGPRYLLPPLSSHPSCPIFLIALLLFKNHKEMLLEESGAPRVLFVCWKLFGGPLGRMQALSRRVLSVRSSSWITSGDKTLTETQGIPCKFSTLDRKINRHYLQRQ